MGRKVNEMLTTAQAASYFGISKQTILARVHEMKDYIGEGKKYPASALIMDGHITRINREAFADFLNSRKGKK